MTVAAQRLQAFLAQLNVAAALFLLGLPVDSATASEPIPRFLNTSPETRYVGSQTCAGCHAKIFQDYRQMPMGRSMHAADAPFQRQLVPDRITVESEKQQRRFDVFEKDSKLYQREYALSESGGTVFETTHQLAYAIGSGVNGYTYLVDRGGYLMQAPLSYYSRTGRWQLSPGYEFADYGFNRVVSSGCLVCHAGQPRPGDRAGLYKDPPFSELAIGCENCHGPGELHVQARSETLETGDEIDRTIVNLAKLPLRLAEDVCMNCHQGGDARVLQPGKGHFDFRPGTFLNDTAAILKAPMKPDAARESDLLEHHFMMKLSACFRATEGRLSCFSCHSIHKHPAGDAKVAYYREKCVQCHSNESCGLPVEQRMGMTPANDCAACHMPKRDVDVISHSSLTNHRIVRQPNQPYPRDALGLTTADLPELIHVNRPAGAGADSLPLLTRFQVFGELLAKWPEFQDAYLALLADAAENHPENPLVLAALGRKAKLEAQGQPSPRAIEYLQMAVEEGSATASTFEDLADMLALADRRDEGIEVLKKGIELNPFEQRLRKSLTLNYIQLKRYPEAKVEMEAYVEIFPEDSFMRGLLEQVKGAPPAAR